jgi:hypothetical protein
LSHYFLIACFFDTGSHYVAQAGLKLVILLPQPLEVLGLQAQTTVTSPDLLFLSM